MHPSTFFTVASLFLISTYSLPQPVDLEATSSIEEREEHRPIEFHKDILPRDGPENPNTRKINEREAHHQPPSKSPQDWCEHHPERCSNPSSGSNSTAIEEREAHHRPPTTPPQEWCQHHPDKCSKFSSGSNSTSVEERQAPPEHFELPSGASWPEFQQNWKHRKHGDKTTTAITEDSTNVPTGDGGDGSGTNSTNVRMLKFKD